MNETAHDIIFEKQRFGSFCATSLAILNIWVSILAFRYVISHIAFAELVIDDVLMRSLQILLADWVTYVGLTIAIMLTILTVLVYVKRPKMAFHNYAVISSALFLMFVFLSRMLALQLIPM